MKKKLFEVGYNFKVWAKNPKEAIKLVNKILVNSPYFTDEDFECGDFEEVKDTGISD
jgi:hypothetical protein